MCVDMVFEGLKKGGDIRLDYFSIEFINYIVPFKIIL